MSETLVLRMTEQGRRDKAAKTAATTANGMASEASQQPKERARTLPSGSDDEKPSTDDDLPINTHESERPRKNRVYELTNADEVSRDKGVVAKEQRMTRAAYELVLFGVKKKKKKKKYCSACLVFVPCKTAAQHVLAR